MKQLKILAAMVAAALGLSVLIVGMGSHGGAPDAANGASAATAGATQAALPWQIERLPDGRSRVLGLTLSPEGQSGASTLADARAHWGPDTEIAVIAAPNEDGTLEAFVDPANAGFVTGKLVITARLSPEAIRGIKSRSPKGEFMESTTRKFKIAAEDLSQALAAPITALGFIPQANLDEATIVARFGEPAERVRSNGHLTHFLYPALGLDIALDTEGKEILQYVAPADFNRLAQPLRAASTAQ
ncbi:hypothetical protein [Aquabacterium sp.]|uniref:hypothetical protein n=1 Tax=Aquabacterium sp. TaxID=1872578 RepID=UPI0025B8303E|nr:hypothetical protein [Aquabacterium sp.]